MKHPAAREVETKLESGVSELSPLLARHGFTRTGGEAGKGSGGYFASVEFATGDRRLRLWLRVESLSVEYEMRGHTLEHAAYMRELLGAGGPNRFPSFSEDASKAFAALRHDLERHCTDFLEGPGDEFLRCCAAAEGDADLTGLQRLARIEQQLRL